MNTNTLQNINIGVDTGKSQLDIYIRPLDVFFTVPNNEKGIKQALATIKNTTHSVSLSKRLGA
ncbi:hypothetical protein TUM17382_32880 [Shewanella algae]|nr:hypothetical protein TUM17382_32880 [Shewanella algae]